MSRATERAPLVRFIRANVPAGRTRGIAERRVHAAPTYERAREVAEVAAAMGGAPGAFDDGAPVGEGAPPLDVASEIDAAIASLEIADVSAALETLTALRAALPDREASDTGNDDDGGGAPPTEEAMVKEGLPPRLAGEIAEQAKKNPALARNSLKHARARLNPNASPFMPRRPPGGGRAA